MDDQVNITLYVVSEREIRKAIKCALEIETADNPLGVFRESVASVTDNIIADLNKNTPTVLMPQNTT